MLLNLENIQSYLTKKQFDVKIQKETSQLYVLQKFQNVEYPTFIRIYEGSDLLQILLFLPCNIQSGTEGDLGRLLHLINKEIDIPGFGMDESSNVIFYRIMLPAHQKQFQEGLLEPCMRSLELLCQTFSPAIIAVAQGKKSYDDILSYLRQSEQNQS